MIFSKFRKPKWQHSDPDVLQLEVENLDDQAILHEMAKNDAVANVRQTALSKINDLKLLEQIVQHDPDSKVQEVAEQRLKKLLCGQKNDCPSLEERLTWFNQTHQNDIITYLAQHAPEVELRRVAIEKTEREGLLGDIALNDSSSEIRQLAVQKLTQKSTLERVFKAARNHDKRISRIAREKLDKLIELEEWPAKIQAECKTICTKLESLVRRLKTEISEIQGVQTVQDDNKIQKEKNELKRLQERWQVIATDANPTEQTRFLSLQQEAITTLAEYQPAFEALQKREQTKKPLRTAKKALCEQMEAWLINLKNRQRMRSEEQEQFKQDIQGLQTQWDAIAPIDELVEEQQYQARFKRAFQSVQKRHQKLRTHHEIATQLETIYAQAKLMLEDELKLLSPDKIKHLQARWEQVSQSEK